MLTILEQPNRVCKGTKVERSIICTRTGLAEAEVVRLKEWCPSCRVYAWDPKVTGSIHHNNDGFVTDQ